jgi:predicted PurR-regulated permease PerM
LAYILTPLVVWISSKRFFKRQISRGITVILLYLVIILSVSFGGAYFVINLTNEIRILVKDIPAYSEQFSHKWVPAVSKGVQNVSAYLPKIQQTQIPEAIEPTSPKTKFQVSKQQSDSQIEILKFFQNTRFEVKQNKNGFEIVPHKLNKIKLEDEEHKFDLAKHINDFVVDVTENLQSVLLSFLDFGQAVVVTVISSIFQTLITLMVAAFIIIDHEKILNFFRGLFPNRFLSKVDSFLQKQNVGLHGVVRGQLIICLVNGSLTAIGLLIFDVKFALTLSLLATVTSLIPIFGVFISSIPIVLMAVTNSFITGLLMLAWILLIHFIEGNILNPKIIGKSAEIHPILVILALMAGQKTYGIFGALIAVPIFSILQTTFIFIREIVFAESSLLKELKSGNDVFDPASVPEKPISDD